MVYTFFFSKIDIDSYLSFEHFLNHLCTVNHPVTIEISIAETGGDLTLAQEIFYRFKNDTQLKKHKVKTYIYSASTAGLFIALTADYKDRNIWQYGTIQYRLFTLEHKVKGLKLFNNLYLIDDELSEFQQILDIYSERIKLDLDEVAKYEGKMLVPNDYPASRIIGEFFVEKNIFTLLVLAKKIIKEKNYPYHLPEIIQRKIKRILSNYFDGMISKKTCANKIAFTLS